jgi:transcriptional regulator with XRE-family HTH domain
VIKARQAKALSQRELAERLGKPRSFVSKIENKERRLDFVKFVVVALALELSPGQLIGEVENSLPERVEF